MSLLEKVSRNRTAGLSWAIALGMAGLMAFVVASPSEAQSVCSDGSTPRPDPVSRKYVCANGSPPSTGAPTHPATGTPVTPPSPGTSGPPPEPSILVRNWETNDDGTTCTLWTREELRGRSETEVTTQFNTAWFRHYERRWVEGNHTDRCPGGDEGDDDVPVVTTEQVWAVFEGQLDAPEPQIVPGRMLTGLTSYLETGRPLEHTNAITMLGLTLEVRATATFMVDWGDGTVTGPHDTPGDPYPDGTVTHVYTDKGTYDVQVIDTWTMEWRFPGNAWSPPAATEMAPVVLEGFDVREYRAVRVTPEG